MPPLQALLQKAANFKEYYLHRQSFSISGEKCAVAFTRRSISGYCIKINGESVPYSRHHIFLGVIVDRVSSCSTHVSFLKKKLINIAYIFRFLAGKTRGKSVRGMLWLYSALFLGVLR